MIVMKKSILVILVFISISCSKDLVDLNKDVKNATTASGETFFTYGVKNLFDILGTAAYTIGPSSSAMMGQVWSQHVTLVTYTTLPQYFYTARWDDLYSKVLKNLNQSKEVIGKKEVTGAVEEAKKKNMLAIIEIMKVQTYAILVETFGDVPYSESLDYTNTLPKYDDAKTVYVDLIKKLNEAINNLDISTSSFASGDPIYNGKVENWKQFGNSLKLKMGMRIIDSDNVIGAQTVLEAAPGVFKSNANNAILNYLNATPNTNPLWLNAVQGNRKDVVIAKPLVDSMNIRNDPRRDIFFTKKNGAFIGGTYGQVIPFDSYSNYGDFFRDPKLAGILMDYSSVEFLLAEAAERSILGSPADAESHYNSAIKASFNYYGISNADVYLAQSNVNYSTAFGSWKEKIGVQKWIALFNQGLEAWTEYRRLDYPVLYAPTDAYVPTVPVRSTYPVSEQTLNGASYEAASVAIGGDLLTTKLFWDIY